MKKIRNPNKSSRKVVALMRRFKVRVKKLEKRTHASVDMDQDS